MKKIIGYILFAGVVTGILTGCGGEYAGITEGDIVSGSAVSGEAVSGDAIREEAVSGPAVKNGKDGISGKKTKSNMSSHRFCTDTNLYYVKENMDQIMQAGTDGTHRKCIRKWKEEVEVEIIYVDMDWLYYHVENYDNDDETTYRAPIEKDEEGQDVVRFQKAEELVKKELMIPMYADSDYYFYDDLNTEKLIKYDLKKKKKVSEEDDELFPDDIFRVNNHYFCVDYDKVYVQKVDSAQWKKIPDVQSNLEDYSAVQNDRAVFVAGYISEKDNDWRVNIKRCDEKEATDFVTWEQMVRTVTEAAGVKELDVCGVEDYFWQEGRLYIQMQAGWMKEGLYHMEYMIISQGENEDGSGSGLRYEKELTECMNSHVKERKGKWSDRDLVFDDEEETVFIEHMAVKDALCIAMAGGKAYLSLYDYEKDKGRLGCYDLDTGKFEWIGKNSAAFYKLACDLDPGEYDDVFAAEDESMYVGAWSWPPSKDKEDNGEFVEDK